MYYMKATTVLLPFNFRDFLFVVGSRYLKMKMFGEG